MATSAVPAFRAPRERLHGIDLVRGLAMVLMALDHARDYFGDIRVDPVDLANVGPALFFTRWVTHFCAPVFVFLAGTSAYLYGSSGRSKGELSRFLAARGLWLIVLEFTLVKFGWLFSFTFPFWFVQVIAAIGVGMLALSALVFVPRRAALCIGLAILLGHNLLDGVRPEQLGGLELAYRVRFVSNSFLPVGGHFVLIIYPLLPWVGVIVTGYGAGPIFRMERGSRRRALAVIGLGCLALFALLRAANGYGDPDPWSVQRSPAMTVASFLDCEKYPPSLAFLAMTLGPAFLLLALVDREPGPLGRALVTFGRVPLFYYLLHMPLIHGAAVLTNGLVHGEYLSPMRAAFEGRFPPWFGGGLPVVYAAWILVVVALYPACRWFAGVKRRSRSPLLSYL